MNADAPVLFHRVGRLGQVELNRPRAINALTHEMVGLIAERLDAWEHDDTVQTVLITGAGERGLCAGGDIVALYEDALHVRDEGVGPTGTAGEQFWRDEYHLDARIAEYPKPVVAVMDGIVLGGGIGLAAHAAHRIVTERSSIGMPEVGIGFLPDVGGSLLLAHAPGELGTHLALTAGSVGAGDAIAIGMADTYVTSDRIPELIELLQTTGVDEAPSRVASPPPVSDLLEQQTWIDVAYAGDDLAEIADRLDADHPDAAKRVRRGSPTSGAVALAALRRAKDLDLRGTLEQDLRLAVRLQRRPDFVEGVRAQVIDKDRNPRWDPPTIQQVDASDVASLFEPLDRPLF